MLKQMQAALKTLTIKAESKGFSVPPIDLRISNKMFKAAGKCKTDRVFGTVTKCEIIMSGVIFKKYDAITEETLIHEFAHAVVNDNFRNVADAHGYEWQNVMRELGIEHPKKFFGDEDAEKDGISLVELHKVRRSHVYVCACGEHNISTQRHNNIMKGARFVCNKCGQRIVYKNA